MGAGRGKQQNMFENLRYSNIFVLSEHYYHHPRLGEMKETQRKLDGRLAPLRREVGQGGVLASHIQFFKKKWRAENFAFIFCPDIWRRKNRSSPKAFFHFQRSQLIILKLLGSYLWVSMFLEDESANHREKLPTFLIGIFFVNITTSIAIIITATG